MSKPLSPPPKPSVANRSVDPRAGFEQRLQSLLAATQWDRALAELAAAERQFGPDARLHHQSGHVLMKLGRALDAYARYSAALKLSPTSIEIRLSIAEAYLSLDDRWSAAAWLSDALRVAPQRAATWAALGRLLASSERMDEWVQLAATATTQGVAEPQMVLTLADELLRRRDFSAAVPVHERLLGMGVDPPRTWLHMGFCREQLHDLPGCVEAYRQALVHKPDFAEAHINLAGVLWRLSDFAGALHHAQRATELAPEHPHAWRIHGTALMHLCRLAEAEPWLRGALQRQPSFPYATLDLALLTLLKGEWVEGWAIYRLRWQDVHRIPRPSFWRETLEWQGPLAQPVAGRTVLLYGEQGLGDIIQFIRWAKRLVDDGATVFAVAPEPLIRLVTSFGRTLGEPERFRVVQAGDSIRFDWHVPLLDLPHHYRIDPAQEVAPQRYLWADPAKADAYELRLAALLRSDGLGRKLRVGLCWAGSDRHPNNGNRSMPLSHLLPLMRRPDVQCVSLQKVGSPAFTDVGVDELVRSGRLIDHTSAWDDFADSAACIDRLDLVITVDSAIAHQAAALGKPTWVLLPPNPDWRWQLEGSTTVWYPSMRLFRRAYGERTPETREEPRQQQVRAVQEALDVFAAQALALEAKGANRE